MSPIVFALVDAWLEESYAASLEMWNCAAGVEGPVSWQLMRDLDAHLATAEERLGWWRSTWVAR